MTNLEIAQAATLLPITAVAERAGLTDDEFEPLGRFRAKLTYSAMAGLPQRKAGKLVLVTAVTPTPAGEGKTTITVGLAQGLDRLNHRAVPAIREPALGPVFGVKGGACGGGYSQVLPMEEINLFFNGDFPAIAAAHNLLSAMIDAHVQNGNARRIDVRMPLWPRTVDMNDRALREVIVGLGGRPNGWPRQDGFVVTPASEVMAVLCLSRSIAELKERLGRMIAMIDDANEPVTAAELGANGAMAALLRDAVRPNLVQTIEGGPALVHGGPFANIAHGCSSLIATQCGLGMADFVVTEAGFASDLGAEKFLHIVAPALGRGPDAIVLVATVRALRHHGDGDLGAGFANLRRHLDHLRQYGPPIVVALNRFQTDTEEDLAQCLGLCADAGAAAVVADPWGSGGRGCEALAALVAELATSPSVFTPVVDPSAPVTDRMETIVRRVYGGDGIELSDAAERRLRWIERHGFASGPVCMAKTQYSLSDEPRAKNAPTGFRVRLREVHPSAGAGFLVAVAGDVMLMPGLGAEPAALRIDVDDEGRITGLF